VVPRAADHRQRERDRGDERRLARPGEHGHDNGANTTVLMTIVPGPLATSAAASPPAMSRPRPTELAR
jgi:hypothetical protein